MSAEKIDVLAVMESDAIHAEAYRIAHGLIGSTPQAMREESDEARAAVAELIAKADNAATILSNLIASRQVDDRYSDHVTELTAALARVQGGQS